MAEISVSNMLNLGSTPVVISAQNNSSYTNYLKPDNEESPPRIAELPQWLYYKTNFRILMSVELPDSVMIINSKGEINIYFGENLLFSYNLRNKNISLLSYSEINIRGGQLCLKNNGKSITMLNCIPHISCSLTLSVIKILAHLIEKKTFFSFVKDIVINCLDLQGIAPLDIPEDKIDFLNFKELHTSCFQRLTSYFNYLLCCLAENSTSSADFQDLQALRCKYTKPNLKRIKKSKKESKGKLVDAAWGLMAAQLPKDDELEELIDILPSPIIFEEEQDEILKEEKVVQLLPKLGINFELFNQSKVKFFKHLHLLYENMKLDVLMTSKLAQFGYFLYTYSYFLQIPKSNNYVEYYLREHPEFNSKFEKSESAQVLTQIGLTRVITENQTASVINLQCPEELFEKNELEDEPFTILGWIRDTIIQGSGKNSSTGEVSLLRSKSGQNVQNSKFPVLYKKTAIVLKILSYSFIKKKSGLFKPLDQHSSSYKNLRVGNDYCFFRSVPLAAYYFNRKEELLLMKRGLACVTLKRLKKRTKKQTRKIYDLIFLNMIEARLTPSFLTTLIGSVRSLFHEIIRKIRMDLPDFIFNSAVPKIAYELIHRQDLYMNLSLYPRSATRLQKPNHRRQRSSNAFGTPSYISGDQNSFMDQSLIDSKFSFKKDTYSPFKLNETEELGASRGKLETLEPQLLSLLNINFHYKETDSIIRETNKLLNITTPIKLKLRHGQNLPEGMLDLEIQNMLEKFCTRRMSVLVGRGAYTINSSQSIITEAVKVLKIKLMGVCDADKKKVELDLDKNDPRLSWPDFHNGVAVALQFSKDIIDQVDRETLRTWIKYQTLEDRSNRTKFENFGLIFGLGLQGMLDTFMATDAYCYLKDYHQTRSIAVLLGMAASRIGTKEENSLKAFLIHLQCTLPENSEFKTEQIVECASLMSIGLLYAKTCKRQYSEMMLNQIFARPSQEKNLQREW